MGLGPETGLVLVGLSRICAGWLASLYIELNCPRPAWVRQDVRFSGRTIREGGGEAAEEERGVTEKTLVTDRGEKRAWDGWEGLPRGQLCFPGGGGAGRGREGSWGG